MSGLVDPPSKVTFAPTVTTHAPGKTRNLPVLSSSVTSSTSSHQHSPSDPMEVTPHTSTGATAPPAHSPGSDRAGASSSNAPNGSMDPGHSNHSSNNNGPNQAIGAAAAAQQPKVVQTAFIHKLYKYVYPEGNGLVSMFKSRVKPRVFANHQSSMLEDPGIQHLISWSSTNDSFVMSPTSEFSKVLSLVLPTSLLSELPEVRCGC